MSRLAEVSLRRAVAGLVQCDENTCARVIADDEEIDQLGCHIDREGVEMLVRYHPFASDLRRVIAGMKLSLALRRIGDQAVEIARKARELDEHASIPEVQLIEEMHDHAAGMVKDALNCFRNEDVDLALTLKTRDRALDEMNAFTGDKLVDRMARQPRQIRTCLNLMFIARHIERIGDHATNIAEDAIYAAAAEDIRHRSVPFTAMRR